MVAVNSFSGLASSPCALARAAAMAPMDSLERCMVRLHVHQIKANRPGYRAFGAQAMADSFLCILGNELFQFCLCSFVLQIRRRLPRYADANSAQELEALISTMRTTASRGRG